MDFNSHSLTDASREELARRRLLSFGELCFPKSQAPRHVQYLANLLEQVEAGQIPRLALSCPPGHGKSTLLQCFVAWALGRNPRHRFLTISASEALAKRNSRDTQALVRSDAWPWPDVTLATDSVLEWSTNRAGEVRAIGRGGVTSGFRAEGVVVDDLQNDAGSEATRASDFEWFRSVLTTRIEPSAWCVVIATRWHDLDIIGSIAESEAADQWLYINLPALALNSDPALHRAEGEPLWPQRWPLEKLLAKKSEVGSSVFSSLYQGSPIDSESAVFRPQFMENRYDVAPGRYTAFRCLAIDGAFSAKTTADPSALSCWATDGKKYYLIASTAERLEFPDLVRRVIQCYREWKPHIVCAESSASGLPLVQSLSRQSSIPIIAIPPKGDKIARVQAVTPLFETNKVVLPKSAPWLDSWLQEHLRFPAGKHDDMVDTTSLALSYLSERNAAAEAQRHRAQQLANFSMAR